MCREFWALFYMYQWFSYRVSSHVEATGNKLAQIMRVVRSENTSTAKHNFGFTSQQCFIYLPLDLHEYII